MPRRYGSSLPYLDDTTLPLFLRHHPVATIAFLAPTTCPPCQAQLPILDMLWQDGWPIGCVDIKDPRSHNLTERWIKDAVPFFVTFRDGQPLWTREGHLDAETLRTDIEEGLRLTVHGSQSESSA